MSSRSTIPDLAGPEHGQSLPFVLVQDSSEVDRWQRFVRLQRTLIARRAVDVMPVLEQAQAETDAGRFVAGFMSYEAAAGIDRALSIHAPDPTVPLVWFGVFEEREILSLDAADGEYGELMVNWKPSMDRHAYDEAMGRIRAYLHAGDTYQVNFTFRLTGHIDRTPWEAFRSMCAAQRARCCAYIETERFAVCSASPELFLCRQGDVLTSMPMKGTCARGLTLADDKKRARELCDSEKTRAENVMIADMIRNDMGRIAEPGSVTVPSLYDVARYPTLWQMTSTVTCRTGASFPEVMAALFPCASVTGAPKVRTMEIIRELERTSRGVYTGAVGYLLPGGDMHWNVAIRTLVVDKADSEAIYGIGSGIVWNSEIDQEFEECLLKAEVLGRAWPEFELLETLRWTPAEGFYLLERHLARLCDSAEFFDFPAERSQVIAALDKSVAAHGSEASLRVRVLVNRSGGVRCEAVAMASRPARTVPWRVCLAQEPVDKANRFLYHKTTFREVYEQAREGSPDVDEVILWNAENEVTEGTTTNVVAEFGGEKFTPPVSSGLLNGTLRQELLARDQIAEKTITCDMLRKADALFLINSVRGWISAELSA